MTRLSITIYLILLVFFAVLSILTTASIGPPQFVVLEVAVDVILVVGVILYLRGVRRKWWRFLFISALAGEGYLLVVFDASGPADLALTVLILGPAIYLGSRVCAVRPIPPTGTT